MKRFVSILAVLALVMSLIPAAFAEDSYIPAPYDPNASSCRTACTSRI